MMLNLQIALEYLLHFIVIQWIYEKTSLVKVPRMILPIAFLVEWQGENHQYVGFLCLLSSSSLSVDF